MQVRLYNMARLPLLLLALIVGCSSGHSEEGTSFEEKEVDAVSLFVSAESSAGIGAPGEIKAVSGGFLLYDYGFQKFHKLDSEGNKLLTFGNEGKGPGEFRMVSGFWEFDDFFLVYDHNNAKFIRYDHQGNWIEDTSAESKGFPTLHVRSEAINPHQFFIPSRGKNGSLFMLLNIENGKVQYFGDAPGDYVNMIDVEEARQAISSGRIPAYMQNSVRLDINQTGIFLFQQTTARLEKYAYSGELIWQKNLKIPAVDGLFNHIMNINSEQIKKGLPPSRSFVYARHIYANEKGVAVLLNGLEDRPVKVVWIPSSGERGSIVTFPGIKNQPYQPGSFTISDKSSEESLIFFVNDRDGEIYKAEWPL